MRVVLDASAAIQIALGRSALGYHKALDEADAVLAPDLFVAEITNAIWKYHQFEKLELDACQEALESALALVDTVVASRELYREAFVLARTGRLPAYDMFYLALARREDATLLTLDKALRNEARRNGLEVL